ncbi:hypothetical protein IFM89_003940, partial [Coptis chinensis]
MLDMAGENIRKVPTPDYAGGYDCTILSALDGFLCVFCRYPCGIVAWVMKDYGLNVSWAKSFCIIPPLITKTLSPPPGINGTCIVYEPQNELLILPQPSMETAFSDAK